MFHFHNPVALATGVGALAALKNQVAGQDYVLLTHDNPVFSPLADQVEQAIGQGPLARITQVADNPDLANLAQLCQQLAALPQQPKMLVALGGGSVIDACKVLAATRGEFARLRPLLAGHMEPERPLPFVAIPTTAGTGSEVTCWATVWDPEQNRKHSLAHGSLYAQCAILEPALTASLPWELTVSTALDALSHALESLWNRNRNPISTLYGVQAARTIIRTLPELKGDLANLELRARLQQASLFAGLAFSNTKTSLAHNISYAVTLDKGLSHGLACSFTLPMLIRATAGDGQLADHIQAIFGLPPEQAATWLDSLLTELGVETRPWAYGYDQPSWLALLQAAAKGQRGVNFSGDPACLERLYHNWYQVAEALTWQE